MFSSRLHWDSPPNPLLEALAAKRAAGAEILDLTESNPTRAGFDYSQLDLPTGLAHPDATRYQPSPRGLREKHERPEGYSVSASKTIAARASALFKAWNDSKIRYKWLADPITIRKATPGKSLRLTWSDGKSSISVNLYAKGEGKSQVTVQHEKIANAKEAAKLKKFWGEKVEKLKELVEK